MRMFTRETYREIAAYLRDKAGRSPSVGNSSVGNPSVGMILGSGLGDLENAIESAVDVPYENVPHFPIPQVEGHRGHVIMGRLSGQELVVMSGRAHFYEGHAMPEITLPVRVMQALGVEMLIVTNAAGGLDPAFRPGDLMLISDHINLVGMSGHNPLWGINDPDLGPRFPDMTDAYDPVLRNLAREVAQAEGIPLREGVYAMLAGPSFETPAEIRFLRAIGADAVGMSTAHEVIVARHAGMRVLGLSGISNVAAGIPGAGEVTHAEVLAAGQIIAPRMRAVIQGVLSRMQGG